MSSTPVRRHRARRPPKLAECGTPAYTHDIKCQTRQGNAAHLDLCPELLCHRARLLVAHDRFLLQAEQHGSEALHRAFKRLRVPYVRARAVQRRRGCRSVIQREQARQDGCVVCKVFLEKTRDGQACGIWRGAGRRTCTSRTTSYSSAFARRSMEDLLSMLLKSAGHARRCTQTLDRAEH